MTISPLPEYLLVTHAIPVAAEALVTPSLQTRKRCLQQAEEALARTAASFSRSLVSGTVCLERETEDFVMDTVTLHYSALSVAQ